jgi:hypothetical protein
VQELVSRGEPLGEDDLTTLLGLVVVVQGAVVGGDIDRNLARRLLNRVAGVEVHDAYDLAETRQHDLLLRRLDELNDSLRRALGEVVDERPR